MSVPKSAKKEITRTCPLCGKKFKSKEYLVNHIDRTHSESIPEGWSASRYENYLRTGQTCGYCTECKKETTWNESTWKYNRICNDPKCRKAISDRAKKNMIGKYGKVHLLNDPEMQRKMIYSKRTSGKYFWSTDEKKEFPFYYASKPEKEFLEMLDVFLNMSPEDCISPSPHNFTYKYEGKDHLYIPDMYIVSLNLEVEIKEPKDNQNMHPKIQAVDKVKEKLKDDLMKSIDDINYIKINGNDYSEFFALLMALKEQDVCIKVKNASPIAENTGDILTFGDLTNELNEILAEISSEPVMERHHLINDPYLTSSFQIISDRIQDNNDLVFNPYLDYGGIIKRLDKAIDSYPPEELPKLEKYIQNMRIEINNQLKYASRDTMRNDQSSVYELNKLIDKIDNNMMPRLQRRMIKYSLENYHILTEASDIQGYKNNVLYKPVFIVLTQTHSTFAKLIEIFKGAGFSHSSISFDTSLHHMCTFGGANDGSYLGFVPDESIEYGEFRNDGASYALYMYMATIDEYSAMQDAVDMFKNSEKRLRYSIRGILNIAMNRESHYTSEYFCSEFVSYVIQQGNPKLLTKHYSLYTPTDLSLTNRFRKVDEGLIKDYNEDKVDKKIYKILNERGFKNVVIKY